MESPDAGHRDEARDRELQLGLHGQRLGFRVRRLHHLLSQRVVEAFAPYGLRPIELADGPGAEKGRDADEAAIDRCHGYATRSRAAPTCAAMTHISSNIIVSALIMRHGKRLG